MVLIQPTNHNHEHYSSGIPPLLQRHPTQARARHNQRSQKSTLRPRSPEYKPLTHKMQESDPVRPPRNVVDERIVDVVGGVHTDDSGKESPRTEGTT